MVHYDSIKARVFDSSIQAYTISPGEQILGLKGFSCYYVDHNGQEVGYAGNMSFFDKYQVADDKTNSANSLNIDNIIPNCNECNSVKDPNFIIDGNKIIHNDGKIYEAHYCLKEKIGDNVICYTNDEAKKCNVTRLYGICDNKGNLLCEIKYDEIWKTRNDVTGEKYLKVKIKDKFGLISFEGKEILPVKYVSIDDWNWNIAVVDHGKKLIAINDLSVLYETRGQISGIVDGWMRVASGEYPSTYIGFLDSSGIFYEFNNKKNVLGDEKYSFLGRSFHDGLLPIFSDSRGYGYVDINGKEVIECKYYEIGDFKNGKAKVRLDCEYGYINTEGCMLVKKDGVEMPIPSKYDWAYDYSNGYFVVQKGKRYGAIDAFLHEIIPCLYKTKEEVDLTYSKVKLHCFSYSKEEYEKMYQELLSPSIFEEDLSILEVNDKRDFFSFTKFETHMFSGFKTANGDILFPPVLKVEKFVEGMAKINISGRWGYINEKLELVIPPKYEYARDFSEGLALVWAIGEHEKFINKYGETVLSVDFHHENVESFCNGVARCEYNPCTPGKDNVDDEISKYKIGYRIT